LNNWVEIFTLVRSVKAVAGDKGKELRIEQPGKEGTDGENNQDNPKGEIVEAVEKGLD